MVTEALDQARGRRLDLGTAADTFENKLARPGSDPRWITGVADAMQGLREAFEAHCTEVEADDGLLPELLAEAPRLAGKITRIENEHITIRADLDRVAGLVESCNGACDDDDVDSIRHAALDVLRAISVHRQKGADLVWEAYSVDIGGG